MSVHNPALQPVGAGRTVGGRAYGRAMAIARFLSLVLDRPDACALADFYGALLDWQVSGDTDCGGAG